MLVERNVPDNFEMQQPRLIASPCYKVVIIDNLDIVVRVWHISNVLKADGWFDTEAGVLM